MTETAELVFAALDREGAEALVAAAKIGFENDHATDGFIVGEQFGVDAKAGEDALARLEQALAGEDEEVARKGVDALDALLSHDRDLIVLDPADGTGLLEPESYGALFDLFSARRGDGPRRERYAATVHRRGVEATVVLTETEIEPNCVRVSLLCNPPPQGYASDVYSGPIRVPMEARDDV